jgi:hypothetical protein
MTTRKRFAAGLFLVAAVTGCGNDATDPATPYPFLGSLPFGDFAFDLLVDDIDDDGLLDLALTAHAENYTQIAYQQAPREFVPAEPITEVGFHPGQLIRVPGAETRFYLMVAEGTDRLLVFEPDATGGLALISQMPMPAPRHATVLNWPDWGDTIAVAPFRLPAVALVKGFDPVSGRAEAAPSAELPPAVLYADSLTSADLDQDGSDELLFTAGAGLFRVKQPSGDARPVAERIWERDGFGGDVRLVIPGDIDGDGDADLLLPDASYDLSEPRSDINLLRNAGNGSLTHETIPYPGRRPTAGELFGITALDYAQEPGGERYLAAAEYSSLTLWRVTGPEPESWEFQQVLFKPPNRSGASSLHLRDLDGDGHLDLIVTRLTDVSGRIIYGPLWAHFSTMTQDQFVLD